MTTWNPDSKNTSSYAYGSKHTDVYSNTNKTTDINYLTKEDEFDLLLETGDQILLEQTGTIFNSIPKN